VPGSVVGNNTVCAVSNTGTVNLTGNNGNVISWMYSTDNGITWLPIVNTNTSYVYTNLAQTTQFGAVVQSGSCPSATTSPNATITVDAASNAGIIRRDTLVCFPLNQGTLTLTNYTGTILGWYSSTDNGVTWTSLGNTSSTYTFANLTDTTQFSVIVQNGICPPDTSNAPYTTVWVRYFNGAKVVPSPDTTISIGFSVQVTAGGGLLYSWTPNYNISDTTVNNPFVWPTKDTTYIVYVQDNYGCVDTASVKIFVLKDYKLIIANTMTPNGDNYNDFFWIGMIEYYPNNEVTVFNRYGQVIFNGKNYDNKKVYWDGTYQGNKVPDGAYYYVIKFTDSNVIFKGSINVISSH
jgi:gliding motility-associated-like protein